MVWLLGWNNSNSSSVPAAVFDTPAMTKFPSSTAGFYRRYWGQKWNIDCKMSFPLLYEEEFMIRIICHRPDAKRQINFWGLVTKTILTLKKTVRIKLPLTLIWQWKQINLIKTEKSNKAFVISDDQTLKAVSSRTLSAQPLSVRDCSFCSLREHFLLTSLI